MLYIVSWEGVVLRNSSVCVGLAKSTRTYLAINRLATSERQERERTFVICKLTRDQMRRNQLQVSYRKMACQTLMKLPIPSSPVTTLAFGLLFDETSSRILFCIRRTTEMKRCRRGFTSTKFLKLRSRSHREGSLVKWMRRVRFLTGYHSKIETLVMMFMKKSCHYQHRRERTESLKTKTIEYHIILWTGVGRSMVSSTWFIWVPH